MLGKLIQLAVYVVIAIVLAVVIGFLGLLIFSELGAIMVLVFLGMVMLLWFCSKFGGRRR